MNDKMELEEAIKYLKIIKDTDLLKAGYPYGVEAIETVLGELDNSIPKKKIEDKIEELDKKIENYIEKKDFNMETNEDYYANIENKAKKGILQELLEEK